MNFQEFKNKYEKINVENYSNEVPEEPLVSVCVVTYQQAGYIKNCLEGILMQETNFLYEILLGEDASSDGTKEICIEYAEKYSDKIRLFLHNRENNIEIAGRATGRFNFLYSLYSAQGKYIALCEGDDYWTDPLKLQKQVEFMEENVDCSLCFHAVKYQYKNSRKNFIQRPDNIPYNSKFNTYNVLQGGGGFMATNSMLFKREYIQKLPKWLINAPIGDFPLMLLLSTKGNIGYIDIAMSVYRKGVKMSWSVETKTINKRINITILIVKMLLSFNQNTDYKYALHVYSQVSRRILKLPKVIVNLIYQKVMNSIR